MTANLEHVHGLIEQLRKEAIGKPKWIDSKQVFEYDDHTAKTVAVLKLARAAQGITALSVLCKEGLFIDMGASIRCVNDCLEDAYFLLEDYPKSSTNVDKYVKGFFENTIDGYEAVETPPVLRQKIRSAMVRVLKGGQDEAMRKIMERIYTAFCGYVHANYAHIMEVYNGGTDDFNLAGVPSTELRARRMQQFELAANSLLHAAAFTAHKLGLDALRDAMASAIDQ